MSELRCIIFDVDGTLVDSQNEIVAAMTAGFAATGRVAPPRAQILSIVGLSLDVGIARLCPEAGADEVQAMVAAYKDSFVEQRRNAAAPAPPLYPGARAALDRLRGAGHTLSIATGKARRGLDHTLASHDLAGHFVATQTADDAPSKPHPGMVLNCLDGAAIAAERAVVIGDTSFDMGMARAAGVRAIGVAWGYHDRARLIDGGAQHIIDDFDQIEGALDTLWQPA